MSSSFRILVACKRVTDYSVRIRVKADGSGVEKLNIKHSMNPFDEIALEESIRLKEKLGPDKVKEIIAVSCGPKQCQDTLRSALAMGADRAIHVEVEDEKVLEPILVSRILQKLVEEHGDIKLVMLGKQAIDDDSNQTGQILAGLLKWPQATFASKVQPMEGRWLIDREIDDGIEAIETKMPLIITTDLRLNDPRYATLQNIMKAKTKQYDRRKLDDFKDISIASYFSVKNTKEPPKRLAGEKLDSTDALVKILDKLK